ncbi:CobQ/CobB/MinD/ParA nucleotide binding domain-containing protein [Lutimaribacter pacificus]|uniref:CobQ/CobB/MinD/ParA nucleotide binding domain-containing protein n=1 Tax=Lutimaribacter pacificus TaxID=391948 RepID=A0A1H0G2C5_9RHOB|nr:ParA family protein [Lutimaribacter pacificus]SDO01047.1 CobQ/CobB/MinD/ParA nucleotide binding domain-containing protein [Lutimaribacter pacificus]SHJ84204.1 CobQ/CobB/MinD/ParA nucleotide binding domain-containing protein [Lutimaribacter pacificus]
MQIITIFNPKGGTGKTTVVMTIASGLIEAGERVAVLDLSQPRESSLEGSRFITMWEDAMVETGVGADQLVTAPAKDAAAMNRALDGFARQGFDYVLVDTGTYVDRRTIDALEQSKLVIAPFRFAQEAAWASHWFAENSFDLAPVFGLSTGAVDLEEETLACATFTTGPVLRKRLPASYLLDTQFKSGHLFARKRRKAFAPEDRSPKARAYWWGAYAARAEVMALCLEIIDILKVGTPRGYIVNRPLATGDAFAHLRGLLEADAELFTG